MSKYSIYLDTSNLKDNVVSFIIEHIVYMQNQLYYNPTDDYLIIDLDEYLD